MSSVEKLLVMTMLSRKAYGRCLFHRMLLRAIAIVGLLLICAIVIGALLVGILLVAHTSLLAAGVTPMVAMLTMSVITLCVIGLLLLLAHHCARQLPRMLALQSPISSRISDVLNAFMDGFMEK